MNARMLTFPPKYKTICWGRFNRHKIFFEAVLTENGAVFIGAVLNGIPMKYYLEQRKLNICKVS